MSCVRCRLGFADLYSNTPICVLADTCGLWQCHLIQLMASPRVTAMTPVAWSTPCWITSWKFSKKMPSLLRFQKVRWNWTVVLTTQWLPACCALEPCLTSLMRTLSKSSSYTRTLLTHSQLPSEASWWPYPGHWWGLGIISLQRWCFRSRGCAFLKDISLFV